MRNAVMLVAAMALCGPAWADDTKPAETPDLARQVADLTAKTIELNATVDDLKRDVEELKRVTPVTLFVPGAGQMGAADADGACVKAKYQGAIALRPATGGVTVLCVSIVDPQDKPLH